MNIQSQEIASFQRNGGSYGFVDPDISVSFSDSQWLAELVRMIYLMADCITLCFTADHIYIFLCTNKDAAVPFYSSSKIDASQLGFYEYKAVNRTGEPLPFVGVTFSANSFYKNITSKVKHTSMDMFYYVARRNFIIKHAPKSTNDPESITYASVLNVECCIHSLPFVAGSPAFQFNSNNISMLFTSATLQSCYYVRMDIHEKCVIVHGFNTFDNVVLYYVADYLPPGCKGTVTFSSTVYQPDTKPYITLCLAGTVVKVLGKVNKITPQGANIGVYLLPQIGVVFLEISIGVIGKNYIGLQTSKKFENKAIQSLYMPPDLCERLDDDSVYRSGVQESGDSSRIVELGN